MTKEEKIKKLLLEQKRIETLFIAYGRINDLDDELFENPRLKEKYDRWHNIEDELQTCFDEKTVEKMRIIVGPGL